MDIDFTAVSINPYMYAFILFHVIYLLVRALLLFCQNFQKIKNNNIYIIIIIFESNIKT